MHQVEFNGTSGSIGLRLNWFAAWIGRGVIRMLVNVRGLGAFALVTMGVMTFKFHTASRVVHPLVYQHAFRAGLRILPMVFFLSLAIGFVVVGQALALLSKVGAQNLIGTIMVTAVVRELGPLVAAWLVLGRVGTPAVIDLGTARAMGEVDTLEIMGIDPIHYLVFPRVCGMVMGVFALSVYLIIFSLASGYFFAFLQDVPILPLDFVRQLASALAYSDFILLALKSAGFGLVIAMVTCYLGLAQPLTLDQVSRSATRSIAYSVVGCILLDALFMVVYLLL